MNIPETAKRLLRKAFSLNPVTLKELRQLVRTKVIIAAMVIYPILLFVVTISMISGSVNSAVANKTPVQSVTMGPQILGASGVGLAFLGCILFPLCSGIRMAQESAKGRTDLQVITALHDETGVKSYAAVGTAHALFDCILYFECSGVIE